jgi:hypothetical protein
VGLKYTEVIKWMVSTIELERETLHIVDDKTKVALVETKTIDNGSKIQPN